jgi:hypothetical protein
MQANTPLILADCRDALLIAFPNGLIAREWIRFRTGY